MEQINSHSIFSPATGFIRRAGFAWTCNPYLGCSFGCTYCYAMFLPQNRRPKEDWGKWFQAKSNAAELARKQAPKVARQAVYMSSVTDPYLPAERSLRLSRGILEALIPHQPRLLIQTRGPLVVRDIDLLKQFEAVRVNMSIPTDSEAVRKAFEPKAPPLQLRWETIARIKDAGVAVGICVTPMLPLAERSAFISRLTELRPEVLVFQNFHNSGGSFGADTGKDAKRLLGEYPSYFDDYRVTLEAARELLTVFEGEAGFFPPKPGGERRSSVRGATMPSSLQPTCDL